MIAERLQVALLSRIARREETKPIPNSEIGIYEGYRYGYARFRTNQGHLIDVPLDKVITRKNYTGTFVITRPRNGTASAHKEV